jgi:hypothetical protein
VEPRVRVQGAVATAVVGAPAVAASAAYVGLDPPLGWAAYGFLIGAVSGYFAAEWIVRVRPWSILALFVLLDTVGVLAFPLLGPIAGLESPYGGRLRIGRWVSDVLPLYISTPIGFVAAVPFLPATWLTAMVSGEVLRWANWDATTEGQRIEPDGSVTGRTSTAKLANPPDASDRAFGKRVLAAFGILVAVPIIGYLWLGWIGRNIGY